jgi:hypothetical protein
LGGSRRRKDEHRPGQYKEMEIQTRNVNIYGKVKIILYCKKKLIVYFIENVLIYL